MSFSFNFELTEYGQHQSQQKVWGSTSSNSCAPQTDVKNSNEEATQEKFNQPAVEVKSFFNDAIISRLELKTISLNEYSLDIVDTSKLEQLMLVDEEFKSTVCNSTTLTNIVGHSDLVDGVYEGGLKVWECGVDLASFLSSPSFNSSKQIAGKRVLELGCGAGLPGLLCIKCGAACVDFQDYNEEVLKLLTYTNVEVNIDDDDDDNSKPDCHYFAGDWQSFCDLVDSQPKYDVILTAETIYNTENYPKLHLVCDKVLTADGLILVAAKEYYFGVGGGVDSFLEYLDEHSTFEYETVWETKSCVPRKILMLKRCSKNILQSNS